MPFNNDPANDLVDRLRLEVGDTDNCMEGLSDNTYQYIIDSNGDTLVDGLSKNSILQALTYLVNKYANYSQEEAGDLKVWDDRYKQYSELLDKYSRDPRYGFANIGEPFAGGISKQDIEENKCNTDANLTVPSEDWFADNSRPLFGYPYYRKV
jgi:hypothetical protein